MQPLSLAHEEWGLWITALCAENVMSCGRGMVECQESASVGCTVLLLGFPFRVKVTRNLA